MKARVEAAIQQKIQGREISLSEPETANKETVIDLMAALRASIDRTSQSRGETAQLGKRKAPKRVEKRPALKSVPAKSKKTSRVT